MSALQQRVLDGMDLPLGNIASAKLHEVVKYLSMTEHIYTSHIFFINAPLWNSLSAADQKALVDSAREAADLERKLNDELVPKWTGELQRLGMKIVAVPDKAPFIEKMKPVWAQEDEVWLVDDAGHAVRKYGADGKELMHLATPGQSAERQSGRPFNMPTKAAVCPQTGNVFVTDGYGNSRVHKFDPAGRHLLSWGEAGTDPGCFNIPHCVIVEDGRVYVVDRENHRIQVFDTNGRFFAQWNNLHRPNSICRDRGRERWFLVAEAGTGLAINATVPNIGNRLSLLSAEGQVVGRIGEPFGGEAPGQFIAPHGIAVDSLGDIYVADVTYSVKGRHEKPPREIRSLHKFARRMS
jgi:hypothetical protein